MSVSRTQAEVSSPEFAEWMAFYALEHEIMTGQQPEPTPEELGTKIKAWAEMQNAQRGR